MKSLLTTLFVASICIGGMAQSPQSFSYQGVARDNGGNVLVNQAIGVRIDIRQGSATGFVLYAETHSTTTNGFGLFNLSVGGGSVNTGVFSALDWSNGPYFIETLLDPTGGTAYQSMGVTQLLSVPYALYAENAGNGGVGTTGPTGAIGPTGATGPIGATGPAGSGDDWGSQVVVSNPDLLEGDGTVASPLNIKGSAEAYRVLRTNTNGEAYWSSFGGYGMGQAATNISNAATSWDTQTLNSQFDGVCDNGICNLILKVYSPVERTVYFRWPNDPNLVEKIYDVPAGRSVIAFVELLNGEYQYYSNVGGQIKFEFVGFFR
ncbi:MAG: hypothetical protein H6603_01285 [Flavobacteriales bacterium]|nr:hypothetical protein [Flavobacteriales bacterium]MCB9203583.1 hypothetical protein [Flavobacteriales bacterium]